MKKDKLVTILEDIGNTTLLSDSCNHLFGNLYFVRTQAGLKKAIKNYGCYYNSDMAFKEIVKALRFQTDINFKTIKFPILIEFIPEYFGYHATEVIIKEIKIFGYEEQNKITISK